jgi:hypothetical protein
MRHPPEPKPKHLTLPSEKKVQMNELLDVWVGGSDVPAMPD